MNLSQLQTNINYRRRDTTESFISNDELTAYVNEALRKIMLENEWEWSLNSTTFSYLDGSSTYALSSVAPDFKMPIEIFYNDDYKFEFTDPESFRMLSASSYNIFATENGNLLVKTSFGSGTLTFKYYSYYTAQTSGDSWIANLSSTTDEPLMPERFQDTLVDFAVARCYQKEGMEADFKSAYQEYLNGVNRMKREYPSKRKTAPSRWLHSTEVNSYNRAYARKRDPLNQI
jgi:hypothetical protein